MSKPKVFVIGPIGSRGSKKRIKADHLFNKVIKPVLKKLGCSFIRAEQIMKAGQITQDIDHELRSVDIVIADLRDLNPNVMYELGIRQGIGLSYILMAPAGQKLPFDIHDYRVISYPPNLGEAGHVKHELKEQVQTELEKNRTGSEDRWLYNREAIARIEENVMCGSIWVVTPDLRHSTKSFLTDVMKKNLQKGIIYTFIFPKTKQTLAFLDSLRDVFSSHPGQLIERAMPKEDFRRRAVSHYLVFEPDVCSGMALRVFLELPIKSREYWIEVDNDAAQGFFSRFSHIKKGTSRRENNGDGLHQKNKPEMDAGLEKNVAANAILGKG